MDYEMNGGLHVLRLNKDELVMLLAVLHEGVEFIRVKKESGDEFANLKYGMAQSLTSELDDKILNFKPKP